MEQNSSDEIVIEKGVDPSLFTFNGKVFAKECFDFEARPLSYSSLKPMLTSPLHFSHNWFNKKKTTPAMMFGNIVDCLLTDAENFDKKYEVFQKATGKGSVAANEEAQERIKQAGKTGISQAWKDAAIEIVAALKSNPKTSWLINATIRHQRKMNWKDKATGLPLVGYLDGEAMVDGTAIIWDLKGVSMLGNAETDKWGRHAYDMGYHLQAGAYCNGYIRSTGKFPDFYHIVYEMKPPYAVNCFRAVGTFVSAGKHDYRKALDRVKYCLDNDTFEQGYNFLDEIGYSPMDIPFYAKQKYAE